MSSRTFRDSSGVEWQVWEVHPTLAERRLSQERRQGGRSTRERRTKYQPRAITRADLVQGWLAFRSALERRRRAPIPPDWERFSDEELTEILSVAERATMSIDDSR